jgi:hypothetical protein
VVLSMVEHPISGFPLIRASGKRGEVHRDCEALALAVAAEPFTPATPATAEGT